MKLNFNVELDGSAMNVTLVQSFGIKSGYDTESYNTPSNFY